MKGPTAKQLRILEAITEFIDEHGYSPSVREICDAVGLSSTATVHSHLQRLRELGYLERDGGRMRTLKVVGQPNSRSAGVSEFDPGENRVPILGRVTAGMPILAVEENEGYLSVDLRGRYEDHFALRIQGDSMIGAGILDGDYIVVRRTNVGLNNQIVVAVLDDEATCKRLVSRGGHVWLMPENDAYEPILGDHAHILGPVVRVVREYQV